MVLITLYISVIHEIFNVLPVTAIRTEDDLIIADAEHDTIRMFFFIPSSQADVGAVIKVRSLMQN